MCRHHSEVLNFSCNSESNVHWNPVGDLVLAFIIFVEPVLKCVSPFCEKYFPIFIWAQAKVSCHFSLATVVAIHITINMTSIAANVDSCSALICVLLGQQHLVPFWLLFCCFVYPVPVYLFKLFVGPDLVGNQRMLGLLSPYFITYSPYLDHRRVASR
jgi:hypothetical protein